jgi:hypothetical protein
MGESVGGRRGAVSTVGIGGRRDGRG